MVLKVSRSALVKLAASRSRTPSSSAICGDPWPCCALIRSSTLPIARIRRALSAQRRDCVRIGGQDQDAVLQVLLVPPIDEILRELVGRPLQNHERRALVVELDLVERRQDRHLVGVERAGARLEHLLAACRAASDRPAPRRCSRRSR